MSVFIDCMWAVEREHAMIGCPWCGAPKAVNAYSRSVEVGTHLCKACRDRLLQEVNLEGEVLKHGDPQPHLLGLKSHRDDSSCFLYKTSIISHSYMVKPRDAR